MYNQYQQQSSVGSGYDSAAPTQQYLSPTHAAQPSALVHGTPNTASSSHGGSSASPSPTGRQQQQDYTYPAATSTSSPTMMRSHGGAGAGDAHSLAYQQQQQQQQASSYAYAQAYLSQGAPTTTTSGGAMTHASGGGKDKGLPSLPQDGADFSAYHQQHSGQPLPAGGDPQAFLASLSHAQLESLTNVMPVYSEEEHRQAVAAAAAGTCGMSTQQQLHVQTTAPGGDGAPHQVLGVGIAGYQAPYAGQGGYPAHSYAQQHVQPSASYHDDGSGSKRQRADGGGVSAQGGGLWIPTGAAGLGGMPVYGHDGMHHGVGQAEYGGHHSIPPPVKNACLSCRTKKARCDGQQPVCGQCITKGRECVFVKSRRGGARKRKEKPSLGSGSGEAGAADAPLSSALEAFLKHLDTLAATHQSVPDLDSLTFGGGDCRSPSSAVDASLVVRTWDPNDVMGILQAYYDEIHPFQPLLPAQKRKEWIAQRLMRDSPFLLACRAILALCPNPADPAPRSLASRALRRSHAAALAREAQDRIDELLNEAGEDDDRQPSIECVQALNLLGLYEFGQTGNAQKNRLKLGQALQLAMELGLHEIDRRARSASANQQSDEVIVPERSVHVEGEDDMKDMQRRTWWVLYAGYLISGLIAGKRAILAPDDSRIQTNYPASNYEDKSWKNWLTGIGLACQAMDVIMTLDFNFPDPSAPPEVYPYESSDEEVDAISDPETKLAARRKKAIYKRMLAIDKHVLDLLKQAETASVIPLITGDEEEVARNQQLAASMMLAVCHIQLHRRQAFPEVALFSRKMCGLPKAEATSVTSTPQQLTPYTDPAAASWSQNGSAVGSTRSTAYGTDALKPSGAIRKQMGDPSSAASVNGSERAQSSIQGYHPNQTINTSQDSSFEAPFEGVLWDPAIYPNNFPTPWFAMPQGAAALYQPLQDEPAFLPDMGGVFTAETGYIGKPLAGFSQQAPLEANSQTIPETPPKPPPKTHKAWGVDVNRSPAPSTATEEANGENDETSSAVVVGPDGPFAPGISLSRCATAAHSIVRLEVLHRSAALALWKGPPKWMPFCACGLVSGAYAFLLLCLAVQAGDGFAPVDAKAQEELEALWTNVKVLSAGLSAYGQMWDGIDLMANEVKAALEAARKLPDEIRSSSGASPSPVSVQ